MVIKNESKALPTDMSVKVGGRVFHPALPVIDGNGPTVVEDGFQSTLDEFIKENIPLESKDGIETRERVLSRMGNLCREWIRYVCVQKGLMADTAGGQLFTSGSYRLGVHEPGADIDTILVAPGAVRREDFFGTATASDDENNEGHRDPNSLAERIKRHPDVTNFVPVEGAAVPILTFDWEGINIDLLFARLNTNTVPSDFDIDNDAVLDGVDSATEKSINGPRVTNLVAAFVNGTPERYQTFLTVVRCVRKWAKARGLYSNKMGYWGGVNINISVAQCLQLYPNACAASLLRKFFLVFKTWRWPQPVMLTKPHDAGFGLPVWSQQTALRQVAPMITPAYPAMNSTLAVSRQTLQILQEEFNRGHEIVDSLWKQYQKDPTSPLDWKSLFSNSDFFISYPNYLSVCIVGPTQLDAQAWAGFVESRLRKLVSDQLARSLPLKKIQLWPKKVEACIADQAALLTASQRQNSLTYFVGFHVDKLRMRGEQLNAEIALQHFRDWELNRFQPLIPGMDVLVKSFKVKELPLICFDGVYEGGKQEAMKKRRQLRNDDPVRQEKRRLARLEELKAKMAEIQRKKEEQQDRKRKRVEIEEEEKLAEVVEEAEAVKVKEEDKEETNLETNLLESALDTVNDGKTREEAAADREKLLAGELIAAENGDGDESDDEAALYAAGDVRDFHTKVQKKLVTAEATKKEEEASRDIRSLPASDAQLQVLRKLGCNIVSDDEAKQLGSELLPPWRLSSHRDAGEVDSVTTSRTGSIKFARKFDGLTELDFNGRVVDHGDEDFTPSTNWKGRKAGFEFKLGLRGLGYYRTGAKVVVPSNTAY